MKKKVIGTIIKPNGTMLKFEDGSEEFLEGIQASLSGKPEDMEEDDKDDVEEQMSEMRKEY